MSTSAVRKDSAISSHFQFFSLTLLLGCGIPLSAASPPQTDVLIVGAGISGLSATLEAARSGATVRVIDMSTVGGGHAIVSNGAICLVNTPLQERKGIKDSIGLAKEDFFRRGEDAQPQWVDLYVRESRTWIYDWLTDLGVTFAAVGQPPGNSVARLHFTKGKGWGLVRPLLRACLRYPNVQFIWSTKAERVLFDENGHASGIAAVNVRSGEHVSYYAKNLIIATGGFGNNLELIRQNWPEWLPKPDRLVAGASHFARGSGMEMVQNAGGSLQRLDHQWNYVLGLPDPDDPEHVRGLASFDFRSIWVNREGRRFTQEFGDPKINLPALLHQTGKTYWSIFDADGVNSFSITLAGWEDQQEVNQLVFQTPNTAIEAETLTVLGNKIGISPSVLEATVARYNGFVAGGMDEDFHTFNPSTSPRPHAIEKAPFYAVQFFPITRKTMGGVEVDIHCRVLNREGMPIPGLYAIGEVTGFGGINGKAALEGTFLGPGILMGRVAARAALKDAKLSPRPKAGPLPPPDTAANFSNDNCLSCHNLAREVQENRPGYWHFEQAHKKVLQRNYGCAKCHQSFYPFRADRHALNSLGLTDACVHCHGVQPAKN